MKQVLVVAVIFSAISFIAAQSPPVFPQQSCVTATNSTGFCGSTWTYVFKNGTDLSAATATAQAQYNLNVAKIANATAQCITALTIFSCQSALPRCGRYQNYQSVLQSRCDAVNSACGVSGFPNNFTGTACVANSAVSVDGPALVCYNSQYTTLGGACSGNVFDPKVVITSPVVANVCPVVSSCNTTASSPTCVRPNNIGDACVGTCVSGTAQVGSSLVCSAGTCQFTGKRQDAPCVSNSECQSSNCTSGKCQESPLYGPCTSTLNCRDNLYCDTKNNTCYSVALQGELCGFVQPNFSTVMCAAGFSCVFQNNATSRCAANAQIGQQCSTATGAGAYTYPLCSPSTLPTNGVAQCINNICQVPTLGALGASCNSTAPCVQTATCQYPSGQTQGTCVAPSSVACDSLSSGCNSGQKCNCGSDQTASGSCAIDSTNPTVNCLTQNIAVQQCLLTNCKTVTSAFFPYDGFSCGATQCLTQINAYYCCVKNTVGANYVAPSGQPTDPCVTPTPTPGPTSTAGPTSTPTTPVPVKSSKSGASAVVVSFVAMIVAVVAFCL